jgi:hypothetical protein
MEFVMKLHPNLRNSKSELVPLSTVKNDLKMALASVRQKLTAHQRAKETEREMAEEAKRVAAQAKASAASASGPDSSPYHDFLLRSNGSNGSTASGSGDLQFKMGFLVDLLKETAHREEDFYAPIVLEAEEQRMMKNEFHRQLFQIVLSSVGMTIVDQQPTTRSAEEEGGSEIGVSPEGNGEREDTDGTNGGEGRGKEKEVEKEFEKEERFARQRPAAKTDGAKQLSGNGWTIRSTAFGKRGKAQQPETRLEITRRLPLWVYSQLADTLALHLPSS